MRGRIEHKPACIVGGRCVVANHCWAIVAQNTFTEFPEAVAKQIGSHMIWVKEFNRHCRTPNSPIGVPLF